MDKHESQPILTLCIPTYNRAKFLNESLRLLGTQVKDLSNPNELELLVSDNHSSDNTKSVVKEHINKGLPITYIRNEQNLGMDGNFVSCFKKAKGKYVWLLGDDDYLLDGALERILSILKEKDYGLLHLNTYNNKNLSYLQEYPQPESFLTDVSYWITFISVNIVKTSYVLDIDFEKYMGSYFTLIPLYMTSALNERINGILYIKALDMGKDYSRNGGYNIFEVFINNFLGIWREMMYETTNFTNNFYSVKRDLFKGFLLFNIWNCMILKRKGNYSTQNGWKIIFKNYAMCPYFYSNIMKMVFKKTTLRLKSILNKKNSINQSSCIRSNNC